LKNGVAKLVLKGHKFYSFELNKLKFDQNSIKLLTSNNKILLVETEVQNNDTNRLGLKVANGLKHMCILQFRTLKHSFNL
jgi:hypothetical protein